MRQEPPQWGLVRLNFGPASSDEEIVVDVERPSFLTDTRRSLVLMVPGRQTIGLYPYRKPHKRMEIKVNVLRGRERSVFVDVRKMR